MLSVLNFEVKARGNFRSTTQIHSLVQMRKLRQPKSSCPAQLKTQFIYHRARMYTTETKARIYLFHLEQCIATTIVLRNHVLTPMLNSITKEIKVTKKKKNSWEPGIQANGATKATSQGSGTSECATLTCYLHSPRFISVHKWHGRWRGSTEHGEQSVWDTADS